MADIIKDDFIKRSDALLAAFDLYVRDCSALLNNGIPYQHIKNALRTIKAIDVQPVVHGKWIPFEFGDYHWHKCSVCGIADQHIIVTIRYVNGEENSTDIEAVRNFCPNCGADMRGGT